MNLYIVRHADAVPVGGAIIRDADRPLSSVGEEDATLMGSVLARVDPHVEIVVTSPFVRARMTGEIIAAEIAHRPIVHATEHLAPGFDRRRLLEELFVLGAGGSVIAVGHQPDVGMFVSFLVSESPHSVLAMPPGAIAALGRDSSSFHLRWLLTPDIVKTARLELS